MHISPCACGNTLFFGNEICVRCQRPVVLCAACRQHVGVDVLADDLGSAASVGTVDPTGENAGAAVPDTSNGLQPDPGLADAGQSPAPLSADQKLLCTNPQCGALLRACRNADDHSVCRGTMIDGSGKQLCDYCALNSVIPDVDDAENVSHWKKVEEAKHRVLYGIERLGFPVDRPAPLQPAENSPAERAERGEPQLSFALKSEKAGPVSIGHAGGLITICIEEADSVEREKTRVQFKEPKRTLVAHFRHELGHYYWERLVKPHRLEAFRALFGDETKPTYAEAKDIYYERGPTDDWHLNVVSGYATMHPWEDFAETFRVYTEMAAVLDTLSSFGIGDVDADPFDAMLTSYRRFGVAVNEINREIGLTDPVPESFSPSVVEKLAFIHELRHLSEAEVPGPPLAGDEESVGALSKATDSPMVNQQGGRRQQQAV